MYGKKKLTDVAKSLLFSNWYKNLYNNSNWKEESLPKNKHKKILAAFVGY